MYSKIVIIAQNISFTNPQPYWGLGINTWAPAAQGELPGHLHDDF